VIEKASVTNILFFALYNKPFRYENRLVNARKAGIMRGLLTGIGGGLMWFIIYSRQFNYSPWIKEECKNEKSNF